MAQIIIDAEESVFGRLCSYAAKQALEGNEIIIVNSEKAIISGNKTEIFEKFKVLRAKGGHSQKGPKYSKVPFMMLKRGIRGMLPDFRKGQGKQAFQRIKCYDGIPEEFKNKKIIKLEIQRPKKYTQLKELSTRL